MFYYVLRALATLIPGRARRRRFLAWARPRFHQPTIVEIALADRLAPIEQALYRTQMFDPPWIATVSQTLDDLIAGKSISRFGDGELELMEGRSIVFQKSSTELSRRLREVLSSDEAGLLVGLPGLAYALDPSVTDVQREFYRSEAPWIRATLDGRLHRGKSYAAAEVTLAHTIFRAEFDRDSYFERCRRIWEDERVVLIHGDGAFDGFSHDIFDNAASVDHIAAPKRDAYESYGEILGEALRAPHDSLMIAALGPTATVLAYDLHRAGYRALDLGHIAKSYEWWRNGEVGNEGTFFGED